MQQGDEISVRKTVCFSLLISLQCQSHAFWLYSHRTYHHLLFKRQLSPGSCHHSTGLKLSLPCPIHTRGNHKSLFSLNDLVDLLSSCLLVSTSHHTLVCRELAHKWTRMKFIRAESVISAYIQLNDSKLSLEGRRRIQIFYLLHVKMLI